MHKLKYVTYCYKVCLNKTLFLLAGSLTIMGLLAIAVCYPYAKEVKVTSIATTVLTASPQKIVSGTKQPLPVKTEKGLNAMKKSHDSLTEEQALIALLQRSAQVTYADHPPARHHQDIFLTSSAQSSDQSKDSLADNRDRSASALVATGTNHQHCVYQHQSYGLGEIVKTAHGWVRCVQTLFYDGDNADSLEKGEVAWITVQ